MKIGIGCDHILERDKSIEMVEALCAIFPDAELYTLAHNPRGVLGPLERKKVHSTFLSNKVKSKKELLQKSFLIPSAAKNLHITCSLDLFIDVSSGFAHGLHTCDKVKRVSYLLDERGETPSGFLNKVFAAYVKSWKLKNLNERTLWVETPELEDFISRMDKESKVLRPFVKIEDFKVIKGGFKHTAFLVNASALSVEMAQSIANSLKDNKFVFKFIGQDEHLSSLKNEFGEEFFFGDKCHGELAPLMSSAAGLIDFDTHPYSTFTLECLASGRPVLKNNHDEKNEELEGLIPFGDLNDMLSKLPSLSNESWVEKSEELRKGVVKFNEARFKTQVKRFLEGI